MLVRRQICCSCRCFLCSFLFLGLQPNNSNIDKELFNLIASATEHRNRFVREMSHLVLSSLIAMHNLNSQEESARSFTREVSLLIARGLSDNWSQVRMSASVVTRKLCERKC